jgi:chromate reductase
VTSTQFTNHADRALADPQESVRLLALVGSLRRESFNHALYRIAEAVAPPDVSLHLANIRDLPFYDEDLDQDGLAPDVVHTFRTEMKAADGFLIVTPEYNHSLPAVLKNAIDWASRPPGASALAGKVAALMGTSTGQYGTARAQQHLRSMASSINLMILPQPVLSLPHAANHVNVASPLQSDPAVQEQVEKILVALRDWARLIAKSPR